MEKAQKTTSGRIILAPSASNPSHPRLRTDWYAIPLFHVRHGQSVRPNVRSDVEKLEPLIRLHELHHVLHVPRLMIIAVQKVSGHIQVLPRVGLVRADRERKAGVLRSDPSRDAGERGQRASVPRGTRFHDMN